MILVGGKQGCNREEEVGGSAKDGLVAARFASETRGPRASSSVEQRLGASATRPFKTLSQSNQKSATKPRIVVVEVRFIDGPTPCPGRRTRTRP